MNACQGPRYFTAHDGRRLAYFDEGAGPPVLCLAGLTRNHRDFSELAEHLSRTRRVIRLDSRGRGLSEHAEHPIDEYSPQVEAGDALELLDHLGLEGVVVIGTSRGGILGMAMASGRPGSVRALILNDVGAVIEGRGLLRISAYVGRQPEADSFEDAARQLQDENRREFPDLPMERWERHARAVFDDAKGKPTLSYDPHLRHALGASFDVDEGVHLWPFFDAIQEMPVLVIRGENSDILTAATVEEMARRHPGLQSVTIPNRGHAPFLDEPEALAAIDAFLDRAQPVGGGDAFPEARGGPADPPARSAADSAGANDA